jgi:response regulator RpfG family c-di-GMP phosphodiesterase/DNA-binding SARP family transcriptional activator
LASHILLIDDDTSVLDILSEILEDNGYQVTTAGSGYEAIEKIKSCSFDLVITDIRMAGLDGLDTLASLRENQPDLKSIVITGYASTEDPIRAIKLRVDDYLKKPFDTKDFLASVRRSLEDFQEQTRYREERRKLREDFIGTVKQIALALERRDPFLSGHSQRVAAYALRMGKESGLPRESLEKLEMAAFLHDLGQVEVEQAVLQKKGALSEEEYERIKNHPAFARDLLQGIPSFQDVIDIILHHHEKYDGSGYPSGLSGEAIPLESRILALAEAYAAILEERPHREGTTPDQAIELLRKDAGTHYDPSLFEGLAKCLSREETDEPFETEEEREEELTAEKKRRMLLELGHTYRDLGQYAVARQAYEESLDAKGPSDSMTVEALRGLSFISLAQGKADEAMSLAEKAAEAAALTNRHAQARVLLTKGRILTEQGRMSEAADILRQAEDVFRRWEATYDLAVALFYRARTASAEGPKRSEEFKAALEEASGIVARFGYDDLIVSESPAVIPLLLEGIDRGISVNACRDLLIRLARKAPPSFEKAVKSAGESKLLHLLDILGEVVEPGRLGLTGHFLESGFPAVREKASKLLGEGADRPRPPMFKVCCLGNFRVFMNDRPLPEDQWKTKKAKYMLAYFASHWQDRIPEDRIFDLFWGDFPQKKARQSLHSALYQVRQILESHAETPGFSLISHEKEYYFVNPDVEIAIDVKEFSDLASTGLKNVKSGLSVEAVASLQRAESTYAGDFLDGYLSDWAVEYRNSLKLRYHEVLLALVRHFHESGRYEVCLEYAHKLLASDICNESAHYYVIKSHIGLGNRIEAMRAYQQCVATMKKEFGMSPAPEIEALRIFLKD